MSKKMSKKEMREFIKQRLGIAPTEEPSKNCKNCYYYDWKEKVCGRHQIKTLSDEVCNYFKAKKKHVVFRGGGTSPR